MNHRMREGQVDYIFRRSADFDSGPRGCPLVILASPGPAMTTKTTGPCFRRVADLSPNRRSDHMDRNEAIARLKQHKTELKPLGVEHLYLFGSTARGDARDDSDVDLFFDYRKGEPGAYELMDVKEATARILGHKTDIMTRDSIHKRLRERIEAAAVPVF